MKTRIVAALILISVNYVFSADIIGPGQVCPNSSVVYYALPGSGETINQFSVSGGTITSRGITPQGYKSITVFWPSSGYGTITLSYWLFAYPKFVQKSVQISYLTSVSPTMPGQSSCLYAPLQPLQPNASGSGPFSYQWYSNTTNTTSGGTLIPNATGSSFTPSSSVAGTKYYYVTVTGNPSCNVAKSLSGPIVVSACNNYEALSFNGTNSRVYIPDPNGTLNLGTGPFTIEAFVKLSTSKPRSIILSKRTFVNGNFADGFLFGFFGGSPPTPATPFFQLQGSVNIQPATGSYNLADGNCHHVAVRRSNDVISFFIDGIHISDGDFTSARDISSSIAGPLVIGSDLPTGSGSGCINCISPEFAGWIGEVRIWNTSLTNSQIASNVGSNLSPQSGLIAYYDMKDQVGSQMLTDLSTNGKSGTLGNSRSVDSFDPTWLTEDQVTCRVAGNFRKGEMEPGKPIKVDTIRDVSLKVKVFPNPAEKIVTVELPEAVNETTPIVIYDEMGKEALTVLIEKGQNKKVIKVEELHNGLYFLRVRTPLVIFQTRIMVSKK